ncbi:protein YgfX [Rheinheimera nanhaiensis]|uniref:Toxin CptA n=1 Tax=Rheinheimera nanhaiensis E407-8 TaxID=562729 RepID=I1E1D7_9GAMM|nr:protein YgfX [Rheinheimera nanhaiensis]GAB60115.1 hypothetical protein RNAN_3129 [Rheinheimera nanhaiensis E407-8]
MSASELVLAPSRRAKMVLMLTALWPPLLFWLVPMPWWGLLVAMPLLFSGYWLGVKQYQQLCLSQALLLHNDGTVHWFTVPASPAAVSGILCGGLVSQWAIKLYWRRDNSKAISQRWVFADQCPPAQFRALARAVNQANWQRQPAA